MRRGVLLALGLAVSVATLAQNREPEVLQEGEHSRVVTTIGCDLVTNYVWRGLDLGDVSLQPVLGVGYKGLSLTAWAMLA